MIKMYHGSNIVKELNNKHYFPKNIILVKDPDYPVVYSFGCVTNEYFINFPIQCYYDDGHGRSIDIDDAIYYIVE